MPSSGGTAGKSRERACLGLPDAFALEQGQGNNIPSPRAKLRQGKGSVVRFSGVVSANPFYEIVGKGGASMHR